MDLLDNTLTLATGELLPALRPWLIVAAGLLAAWTLHGLLWHGVERFARGRRGLVSLAVPRLRRLARLALVALVAVILVRKAGLPPAWRDVLSHVAIAAVIVIAGRMTMTATDVAVRRFTSRLRLDAEDNLTARRQVTQVRVLQRTGHAVIILVTAGLVLATFETVRQYGVSLFASAGAAGLVLGLAARPVLANLIAGLQIALTQPIRIDDVVIVEGEWGWIEEIASTYVIVRIWDLRRMVVPLSQFIEQPFQNWTRETSQIIGSVYLYLSYAAPMEAVRARLRAFVEQSPHWDGDVVNVQVVETDRDVIHVRGLMSARNSPKAWDLRCEVRENMLDWLHAECPQALPRVRAELEGSRDGYQGSERARSSSGSSATEKAETASHPRERQSR